MRFLRVGLLSSSVLLSACGANVVFAEDGGEGGNGTGAGNQGGSTGTFSTTSSPDTTTGIRDGCEAFCDSHSHCIDGDCHETCRELYAPDCEAEAAAMLRCLTENFTPGCDLDEGSCAEQRFAYEACALRDEDCRTDSCEDLRGGCSCSGICSGVTIEQSCGFGGNGQAFCECFIDGKFRGECQEDDLTCSIEEGCCGEFFFEG